MIEKLMKTPIREITKREMKQKSSLNPNTHNQDSNQCRNPSKRRRISKETQTNRVI